VITTPSLGKNKNANRRKNTATTAITSIDNNQQCLMMPTANNTSNNNVGYSPNSYVQVMEKQNGSLHMKITIPDCMNNNNNSNSMDKNTDEDDLNPGMIEHYHGNVDML
jgi:hypothetical protein